ncbi:MAG: AsmA family protein [Candidatus Omnitrophica bacterium]|nr:AsmA family protein [Candidatus Omnitrophota bacterium]
MSLFQFVKRRFVFIVILIAVLLLGAGALVVLNLGRVVNSNKEFILAKAKEAVGREISIDQIDVTLWTGVGVRLSNFSIADDPTFSTERFVQADNLEIYFKLMPLFRKQLEISHLTLVKPAITIIQNKEGDYNFSTILADESSGNAESAPPPQNNKSAAFSLARLEIEDGVIDYKNETNAEEIRLQNLDATVRDFSIDQSFSVDLKTALLSESQNISFRGQVGPLAAAGQDLSINGDLGLVALPLPTIAKMPVIQSSIPSELKMDGAIDAQFHLEGNLKNLKVNVDLDGGDAAFVYNQQYEKPKGMPLNIAVQSNYAGDNLDVQNFKFKSADLEIDGKGQISLGESSGYDFSLQSKPFDLSLISSILPKHQFQKPSGRATIQFNVQKKKTANAAEALSLNGDVNLAALSLASLAQIPVVQSSIPKELKMDGAVDAKIHVEGDLSNLIVNADLDGANAALAYNQQYEKPKGTPLNIAVQSKYAGGNVDLQNIKFKAADLDVEGKGKVSLGKTFGCDLSLQSKPFNLSFITTILPEYNIYKPAGQTTLQINFQKKGKTTNLDGIATLENVGAQVPKLAKPISGLKGIVRFDLNQAKTDGLTLRMGQSDIRADASINPLSPITMKYSLASSKIAVSDLIDPPESMKNDFLQDVVISGALDMKEGLQSSGDISSKQGALYGLNYTNLKSPFQLKDQIFTLSALSLQTLKGEVEGQIRYDMQKDPAQFDISTQTHSIDLAEAVRTKASWLPDYIQGKVNLNLNLTGSGTTWEAIQPSLKGSGAMDIAEGMLLNVNIADSVLNGLTGMPGIANFVTANYKQEYPRVFNTQHTVFEALKMETAIQGGRIDFKNMMIAASDWAVNGEGWMNFGQQLKSDSLLRLSKNFTTFLTGKVDVLKYLIDENGNLSIPFSMNGTLPTVKPQPNSDFVGGILQKAVAGKVMDKLNLQGIPGLPNILPLPFESGKKTQQELPPISADKTASTTRPTDATRVTSPARGSLPQVQSATSIQSETPVSLPRAATTTISKPTEIKPTDLLNPLLNILNQKKKEN